MPETITYRNGMSRHYWRLSQDSKWLDKLRQYHKKSYWKDPEHSRALKRAASRRYCARRKAERGSAYV